MPTRPQPPPPVDAMLSPRAAATLSGLSVDQVRALIRRGALRVWTIRRVEYVSLAELERVAAREAMA